MSFVSGEIPSAEQPGTKRIISIDLLRGLVMVLMALDHTRDFLSNVRFSPTDLTKTTVPLFLTRWITHLCAPTFIFLAGVAVYLYFKRRPQSKLQLSQYLIIRGLWLVFLELTVVHMGWIFDPTYSFTPAGVLWAIGWSMVVLAALVRMPIPLIAALGILLIGGHNLFDNIHVEQLGRWGWLWAVLHEPKIFTPFPHKIFAITYPLIPWIGVMATGYAFGTVFYLEKASRLRLLRSLGLGLIAGFVVLRALNLYGDPHPWKVQTNLTHTILSFINCNKYPPSLLYLLITLGIAMLLLYVFEKQRLRILKPLVLFGQVPLFFYIIHIWLVHFTAILLALPKYGLKAIIMPFVMSSLRPANYGYDLPTIYKIWIFIIILLYPICSWYMNYKTKHRTSKWLKFL
ncbi:heparan-alpha-glucosaminide N-acetyltransferase domain-containing protein [Aetokthonos hydrillicola Thurmond2011]|jgi:uncharacterized membrane protein|uniref:Heparan-alpha-glucosaminide N-acetyltransferase domain-containing protein n=1 Tax=Aetokthonos hydrillicola Thurmond2011 TaxID=2712845 RepID=A0AAP5IHP1_9CYAN|nr:heparan-alpha-glucosaminide N-acetyltransferase domain-containing protein [Aetokthonos hydrillicola]MBO3462756.1 DUF1624 domain-containing protein [Aetokthonos hydrillicola CCALA 1050]MBW4589220.1 DUF1624 domain-containing protein [Aetokthonos hydrillicola CCALA 1050]MDR9900403.1 heparan-alpha-glucosaminide N-acetyltransferase domain-containing protein [Aetokthonos hydrillicola Thurmond2011]